MAGRLAGKVSIVTGAGQGIGEAVARRFAAEGATVVVAELNGATGEAVARSLREQGAEALAVQTDVADRAAVSAMVAQASERYGAPAVLVNNAGINVFRDPLQMSEEDWKRCFSVDLDGVWYGTQAVLPHMLEAGGGAIVNVASIHSVQIIPGCFPYPVAKHGVLGLTRAIGVEYAARGVRCNAVCPAYVDTDINRSMWATMADPEGERATAEGHHPMQRIGQPEEVANAVLFLASDEASFITATSLMVDGGGSMRFHA